MSANKIAYAEHDLPLGKTPHYKLAKGSSTNPNGIGTCDLYKAGDREGSGITNSFVLERMKPVARVQSRHRVSKSPRKIPNYELDVMALEMLSKMAVNVQMPLEMMLQQQSRIRRNLPRFR